MNIQIQCDGFILRLPRMSDKTSIAKYANNKKISANLRDAFPYPYSEEDAVEFISRQAAPNDHATIFSIDVNGEVVGGIGIHYRTDVERVGVELGYWLGEPFWGRGIITKAIKAMVKYTFDNKPEIMRIFAIPYEHNKASTRVLEKAGFVKEGIMRNAMIKDGALMNALLYSIIREEYEKK